jgi:hypothetical protein
MGMRCRVAYLTVGSQQQLREYVVTNRPPREASAQHPRLALNKHADATVAHGFHRLVLHQDLNLL